MFSIQWFQVHHIITFSTIYNEFVGLSGARVSTFQVLVPQLIPISYLLICLVIVLTRMGQKFCYNFVNRHGRLLYYTLIKRATMVKDDIFNVHQSFLYIICSMAML